VGVSGIISPSAVNTPPTTTEAMFKRVAEQEVILEANEAPHQSSHSEALQHLALEFRSADQSKENHHE
jgi:hypothetical protein